MTETPKYRLEDHVFHQVTKLSSLIDEYDAFFFDIWGVLHEGGIVYPGVPELFNKLAETKIVRVISNAPRLRETTVQSLQNQGLNISSEHLYTSGETARIMLQTPREHLGIENPIVYHIGEERNTELLAGLNIKRTDDFRNSNLIVLSGYKDHNEDEKEVISKLEIANAFKIKVLCANPDKKVINLGEERKCAGFFADIYEKLGGEVIYSGKPEKLIFEQCMESFDSKGKRILMIGDTFATDIKGAHNVDIDSGLVLTGNMGLLIKEELGAGRTDVALSSRPSLSRDPGVLSSAESNPSFTAARDLNWTPGQARDDSAASQDDIQLKLANKICAKQPHLPTYLVRMG